MNEEADKILNRIKNDLWEMFLEEDMFSFCPKIRTFLSIEVEQDVYDVIKLSRTKEEAKNHIKSIVELCGELYEFTPSITGKYYPFDYIPKLWKK